MANFIEEMLASDEAGKRELARAELRVAVTEGLLSEMAQLGVSKAELADRIGISRSAVTQALSASRNLSLNTLADMADALKLRVRVSFVASASITQQAHVVMLGQRITQVVVGRSPVKSSRAPTVREVPMLSSGVGEVRMIPSGGTAWRH